MFPEYTSGHSVASRAAATVLTGLAGVVPLTDTNHTPRASFSYRRFASFHAAAQEAATSRLYGGIHYPMAIDVGPQQGEQVGRHVLEVPTASTGRGSTG
ncbi:MAG: hypothetical protein ACT4RN_15000 [Pseudonocardia sp.]